MDDQLRNGDRVCIIGGGPAGSFSALHLLKLARARGLHLEVMIFEPRDGSILGPHGCKGCAGILSAGALHNLATLGLTIPDQVVRSDLRGYIVHVQGEVATFEQPDPQRRIISVYRGAGPRLHQGAAFAGFDSYLLSQAQAWGATWIPRRVRQVVWDGCPIVKTDDGSYPAALVVLATGVNSRPPLSRQFGYEPPETAIMAQDEVLRPEGWPADKVAGFFGGLPELVFGALVPKGPYLNVSLLWRGRAVGAIQRFYEAHAEVLRRFFPDLPQGLCGCYPRINVRPARICFGDRWVAVGDAAVTRLYKDGINSAFLTAGAAMRAAVEYGVTRQAFQRGYMPLCRRLALDNFFGKLIYQVSGQVMRSPRQARAYIRSVCREGALPPEQRVHSRLLWGMLTGDEPYCRLFWLALHPRGIMRWGHELARIVVYER